MAVRPVLTYPHPMLKEKASGVPIGPTLEQVLLDLTDTLRHHPGCVGLAAPQIGYPYRCVVVDVSGSPRAGENHGFLRLVGPRILEATQWKWGREGCLSFPDLLANVKRAQKLRIAALDVQGQALELRCQGYEAVAIQHEMDHLDGILFLDRIRSSKDLFERQKPAAPTLIMEKSKERNKDASRP
ncbi:MAG TPA: peptide deformylase [bacterium]|nr:peptide deformylase [bacterium]